MCSAPKIHTPPPVQAAIAPDFADITKSRKKNASLNSGALLTSPSGVSLASSNYGGSSLLGS